MSLKIALILDSVQIQEWQRRALDQLLKSDSLNAKLSLIIINEEESGSSLARQTKKFINEPSLWKVMIATGLLKDFVFGQQWYSESLPIQSAFNVSQAKILGCSPETAEDYGNLLPDEIVSELRETDIAIRFGFGILKGDTLTAPRYGVLSYHHGDLEKYRGRPAGFYEFLNGEDTAGVTIQRLTEALDAGEIAARTSCDIGDAKSWPQVKARLFEVSPPLLVEAVENTVEEELHSPRTTGTLFSPPNNRQVLQYLQRRLR